MWCPRCRSEYPQRVKICPMCRVPLADVPAEDPAELPVAEAEFLMRFTDPLELGQATELLERAGIPYFCQDPGLGEVIRLVGGRNPGGTELYVDRRCTHRALRLLRRFDPDAQTPFDQEELETAMEDYMALYGVTPEEEDPQEPVSPEGYRMVWGFLAIFALLAVLWLVFGR